MVTAGARWATRTRRAIVECLAERPRAVGELADALPISRPAVSQHLKVLKDAGLVAERVAGTRRIYRLNPAGVAALRDQLDTYWNRALAGFQDAVVTTPTVRTDRRRGHDPGSHRRRPQADRRRGSQERAFTVFTERLRRLQAARAQHARRRRSPRPCSSRAWAGTSSTAPRTAASAAGPACSPTSRTSAWCSAGTSARTGSSRPTRRTPARSRSGSSPRAPTRTRVELEHRNIDRHGPGWEAVRDGVANDAGLAAVPRPLRSPVRRGPLTCLRAQPRRIPAGSRCEPFAGQGGLPCRVPPRAVRWSRA